MFLRNPFSLAHLHSAQSSIPIPEILDSTFHFSCHLSRSPRSLDPIPNFQIYTSFSFTFNYNTPWLLFLKILRTYHSLWKYNICFLWLRRYIAWRAGRNVGRKRRNCPQLLLISRTKPLGLRYAQNYEITFKTGGFSSSILTTFGFVVNQHRRGTSWYQLQPLTITLFYQRKDLRASCWFQRRSSKTCIKQHPRTDGSNNSVFFACARTPGTFITSQIPNPRPNSLIPCELQGCKRNFTARHIYK